MRSVIMYLVIATIVILLWLYLANRIIKKTIENKRKFILDLAEVKCIDRDGDLVHWAGCTYYVNLLTNEVRYIGEYKEKE